MKQFFTYPLFLKSIIGLLLIGQLWTNTISHCFWLMDTQLELIELCDSEDSESEEKMEKKEKEDESQTDLYIINLDILLSLAKISLSEDFFSLHHPEITTPPPEYFFF